MKRIQRRWQMKKFLFLLLVLGMILAWGSKLRAEAKPSLAILPFFIERGEDPGRGVICPICKRVYSRGEILPGSKNTLSHLLQQKTEVIGTFKVLPLEKVEEALSHWNKKQFEE